MTEQKGLKINVSFQRHVSIENKPYLSASIYVERAEGVSSTLELMQKVIPGCFGIRHCVVFDTATEAETWAAVTTEKLRMEYTATVARIKALKIPKDFEVFE